MKTLRALVLSMLALSTSAFASDYCTTVIREYSPSGYTYEYDNFTKFSYSVSAACSDAQYECQRALSEYQARGRFYNASCAVKSTSPSYPSYPTYPSYPSYPSYPTYPSYPRDPYPRDPYPRDPRPSYPRDPRDPRNPGGWEPNHPPRPRDPGPGPRPGGPGRPR